MNLSDEFKAYGLMATGNIDYLNIIASIMFKEKWAVPMKSLDDQHLYAISTTIPKTETLSFDDLIDIAADLRIRSKSEYNAAKPAIIERYKLANPDNELTDEQITSPLESMIDGMITYGMRTEVLSKFAMRPWDRLIASPKKYTYADFTMKRIVELSSKLNDLTEAILGSSATTIIEDQVQNLITDNPSLAFLYNVVHAMESKNVALGHVAPIFALNDMFDNHDFATMDQRRKSTLKLKRGAEVYEFGKVESGGPDPLDGIGVGDLMTYIELFENTFIFNRSTDIIMSDQIKSYLKSTTAVDIDELTKMMASRTVTGSVVFSTSVDKIDNAIARLAWLFALRMVLTSNVPESKIDVRYLVESYRLDRAVTLSLTRTFNVIECMIKAYVQAYKVMVSPIKAMLKDCNYQKSWSLNSDEMFPSFGDLTLGYTPDYIPVIVAWNEADFNVSANQMVKRYMRYRHGRMKELLRTTENRSFNRDILRPYDDLTWIESINNNVEVDKFFSESYTPDKDDALLQHLSNLQLSSYYIDKTGETGWLYLTRGIQQAEIKQIVRTNTDIKPRNLYEVFRFDDISTMTGGKRQLNVVFRNMEELYSPFELYYLERRNLLNRFVPHHIFDDMDEDIKSQIRLTGYEIVWLESSEMLLKYMGLAPTVEDFRNHYPQYYTRFFNKDGSLKSNKIMILEDPSILDKFRIITSEALTKNIEYDVMKHEAHVFGLATPFGKFYKPNRLYIAEVEVLANVHRDNTKLSDLTKEKSEDNSKSKSKSKSKGKKEESPKDEEKIEDNNGKEEEENKE